MSPRSRPDDCCSPPAPVDALSAERRERLVALFRALGDPTRVEMLRLIAAQDGPICVCDVVERFELRQPTISHHLKILRDAGLVTVSRRGVWAYYTVNPTGLEVLRRSLDLLTPARLAEAG